MTVETQLDARVVINNINAAIYIFEHSGKTYFTRTMLLDFVNEQIGWPRKNDKTALAIFYRIVDSVLVDYTPSTHIRGGYTFQLLSDQSSLFTTKLLK